MKKILALDIGGTGIKAGLLRDEKISEIKVVKTNIMNGLNGIVESICSAVDSVWESGIDGIAISSAGDIDPFNGICVYATDNLPEYSGFNLKQYFQNKYKVRTEVINDGHAALLGELKNISEQFSKVVMLTLGTGLGGAYSVNREIIFGDDYKFGRFGHIELVKTGRLCTCGKKGCIERYASATGLILTAKSCGLEVDNAKELFALYSDGNQIAIKSIDIFINDCKAMLDIISRNIETDVFVLGGAIIAAKDLWLSALLKITNNMVILPAVLGNRAGLLGAYKWFVKKRQQ